MPLRRELLWTVGSLALLNLLLAFGAIGLFVRMGPAIERILQENIYSIVAAEEILFEMARAGGDPLTEPARKRVEKAFARAQRNVTEAAERPLLASIATELPAAMQANASARIRAVGALQQFVEINRRAMEEVDMEAQRLGTAGAWGAVLIGFLSFVMTLFVLVRLQRRVLNPLIELLHVLEGAQEGIRMRRCRAREAPQEVMRLADAINQLLDERLAERTARYEGPAKLRQLALSALMEREADGMALVAQDGRLLQTNQALLMRLSEENAAELRRAIAGGEVEDAVVERVAIRDEGWLVRVPQRRVT